MTNKTRGNGNLVEIRHARPQDAKQLARLHYVCSTVQPGAFMHLLGQRFFVKYYKILLRDQTTVILCADAGNDGVVGLASAAVDSKKQLEAIHRGRFGLFLAVIPAICRKPSLLKALKARDKSCTSKSPEESFVVNEGARIAYWCWLPGFPSKGKSIQLLKELMRFLENQGGKELQLEVDRINRLAEVTHRFLGAKVVKEFNTVDGRKRIVMKYQLSPTIFKLEESLKQYAPKNRI